MRIGRGTGRTARWLLAAVMAFGASVAMAQISGTKHNLGSTGTAGNNQTSSTGEICVFCHTPHAADVSTVGVPLWNKRLNTGAAAFQTYSSSTMNAIGANDGLSSGVIGSVSLACLSCHDGSQAMDNIINAPNTATSSVYDPTGGLSAGLGWNWTGSPRADADGYMTGVANLGRDLRNDHPIGIQYCGGGPKLGGLADPCQDPDFVAPSNGSIGGTTVFWVEPTGANATGGGRQKGDIILFNRTFDANGTALLAGTYPSVECASCHDPHSANATFLRMPNTGSAVCLTCHAK